ncbi:MAG TPA: hypothetical protein VNN55_09075 [bacterium]|nr:hypothetical protein [bacterium]
MPSRFEKYRFRDGVTPLSEDTFNRVLRDIDLRIVALEEIKASWEEAVRILTDQGLLRINEALLPALETLQYQIDHIVELASQVQVDRILDAPDQVTDTHIGNRTADPSLVPTGNIGTLTQWFGRLANRIKAITGAANWYDAPATTLAAVASTLASHAAQLASAAAHAGSTSNPHATTAAQVGALPLSGGNLTGSLGLSGNAISGVKTVGFQAEYDNGNSGTSKTISLANGQKQRITLTANATLTISTTGASVGNYTIRIKQDATGGRTVTWSGLSSSRWLGASSPPPIHSAANGESILSIYFDGTTMTQTLAKVGAA